MAERVLVMAGGTGGHVYPALAVAEALRLAGVDTRWLGSRRGMECDVVTRAGFPFHGLRVEGLRGRGLLRLPAAVLWLAIALLQAAALLLRLRPQVVLGMGGYASGPGGVAAWLLRFPLVIHEQNARAGTTNRWLARVATAVAEAFPGSFPGRPDAHWTGNPLRHDFLAVEAPETRLAGRGGPIRLLVLGGSQGALALNRSVPAALALAGCAFEVRHQCGRRWGQETELAYAVAGVAARIEPFIEDVARACAWADLVICRAGALTVSELAAVGVAAVFVPFPHAIDDHQSANAAPLVAAGAALLVQESPTLAADLARIVACLAADRGQLVAMAGAARGCARLDATERLVELCRRVARD